MIGRRELLKRGGWLGAVALGHGAFLRSLLAAEGGSKRNLVFVELDGGNDGLNTIVPFGVDGGLYSTLYRPLLQVPAETLLPLDDALGFHPRLAPLMPQWDAGRMAAIVGVGSPLPTFSHDFAKKVWATGDPTGATATGWFGRYLASQSATKPRAFDVARFADPMFAGAKQFVPAFPGLDSLKFPVDKKHPGDAAARRKAFLAMHAQLAAEDSMSGAIASTAEELVGVIDDYSKLKPLDHALPYPSHPVGDALALVARLLLSKLGLRFHHVAFEGFDTHAAQNLGFLHEQKLDVLARALAAFQADLDANGLAQDTLVVVYSEFGRALFENASLGTDHGTAGPVIVLGNGVAGGRYGEHPSLAPEHLSPIQEMVATVDYRDVLGTVAMRWLQADPGPLFPGHAVADLGFLR